MKTIVAMPYALGDECGEVHIESRGTLHRITFTADAVQQVSRINHEIEPNDNVKNGTSVTVFSPDSASARRWVATAIASGTLTIGELRSGVPAECTLQQYVETAPLAPEIGQGANGRPRAPERFFGGEVKR